METKETLRHIRRMANTLGRTGIALDLSAGQNMDAALELAHLGFTVDAIEPKPVDETSYHKVAVAKASGKLTHHQFGFEQAFKMDELRGKSYNLIVCTNFLLMLDPTEQYHVVVALLHRLASRGIMLINVRGPRDNSAIKHNKMSETPSSIVQLINENQLKTLYTLERHEDRAYEEEPGYSQMDEGDTNIITLVVQRGT